MFVVCAQDMSATIYNVDFLLLFTCGTGSHAAHQHRSLQAAGSTSQPQQPSHQHSLARLNDSLEIIRQEYDALTQDITAFKAQKDDFEVKSW